jgi:hypothetical protein
VLHDVHPHPGGIGEAEAALAQGSSRSGYAIGSPTPRRRSNSAAASATCKVRKMPRPEKVSGPGGWDGWLLAMKARPYGRSPADERSTNQDASGRLKNHLKAAPTGVEVSTLGELVGHDVGYASCKRM